METTLIDDVLPPSARLVLNVLMNRKILRFEEIMLLTGLSKRSLLYAIKVLREKGLVEVEVCMSDTRRRFYCLEPSKT
ncbi:MAG: MarR family transcriptional regulator [Thermoplasmatales archaeon]|nr:MarR family transcriptional regulator [Thermoplasmatales archaeon]